MIKKKIKFQGFTLIELLVVIAVIGLLATLSVIALSNARAKSRDSKRLADVKQLQTSLELYYDQTGRYPSTGEFNSGTIAYYSDSLGTTTYMKIVPTAPMPNDGPCSNSGNTYYYAPTSDGSSYTLSFCIGGPSNNLAAGLKCATPGGIINNSCAGDNNGSGGNGSGVVFNVTHAGAINNGLPATFYPNAVAVSGNYAYVASYDYFFGAANSFEVVDISDKAHPVRRARIGNGTQGALLAGPYGIALSGHYAYVISGIGNTLQAIDISDPLHPTVSGSLSNGGGGNGGALLSTPYHIVISGAYAYIANYGGAGSLEIVNISNPSSLTHVAKVVDGDSGPDGAAKLNKAFKVLISGNYAYVAAFGSNALQIIDITDPANPQIKGSLSNLAGGNGTCINGTSGGACLNHPASINVVANYAFMISQGSGALEVVDISDKDHPTHLSSLLGSNGVFLSTPTHAAVSGNYLYVASQTSSSLDEIDISNPSSPTHVTSFYDNPGIGAYMVVPIYLDISGAYAYVVGYGGHSLEIVNISNPNSLQHAGNAGNSTIGQQLGNVASVFIAGNRAYAVGNGGSLEAMDISNPIAPTHLGDIEGSGGAQLAGGRSVFVSGSYAYVVGSSNYLDIVDVSNPASLTQVQKLGNGSSGAAPYLSSPYSVFVSGSYAYVASQGSNALEVVDVSTPSAPTHAGSLIDGAESSLLNSPYSVYVSGSYAYLASRGSNALEIVNVSDPTHPHHASAVTGLTTPQSVYVVGNYAYVAGGGASGYLSIVDISSPNSPALVGTLTNGTGGALLNNPRSVFVSGSYAYVANQDGNNLEVIDITTKSAPAHLGSLADGVGGALLNSPRSVFVSPAGYIYVASYNSNAIDVLTAGFPQ